MPRPVIRKWRPPLALVLGGTLSAVFFLPLIGIAYFRVAGGILGWRETSWMIGVMALAATLLLGWLLWRLVLRPVRALTAYAKAEGAVAAPEHFGTPEFSELGSSVITMTNALRGREAVLRSYADHVTHEMKSPLSTMRGAAELLEDDSLPPEDRARLLQNIQYSAARMEALLASQRAFANADTPLGDGTCQLGAVAAQVAGAKVTNDGSIALPPEVVRITLTHLAENALAHGATHLTCAVAGDGLRVSDDGPGISAGNRARVFDPFFTTRRDAGGTGMGLAIVRRMLDAHGAEITLTDSPGATFLIRW